MKQILSFGDGPCGGCFQEDRKIKRQKRPPFYVPINVSLVKFDFYKNASDFTETYNVTGLDFGLAFCSNLTNWSAASMQWLDPVTENSTTEKTYKISLRSTDGSTAYCGWGAEGMSSITAWEIAQ